MTYRIIIYIFVCLWMFSENVYSQDAFIDNPSLCQLGISIPDDNCRPDGTLYQPVQVVINSGNTSPGAVLGRDVFLSEVRFVLLHTWASDLKLTLVSPSGIQVDLVDGAGGGEDDFGSLVPDNCTGSVQLSMAACQSIQEGIPPFLDGDYLPAGNFFDFNDGLTMANDPWMLLICDQYVGDVGTLEYFELVFEPMTCLPVVNVEILESGIDSVRVSWDNPQACETVILEYGTPGFVPGVDSMANGGSIDFANCSPATLTGLFPDTEYELYVRTYCAATGNFSSNSCPLNFQTQCLPPAVSLLTDFDDLEPCSSNCSLPCPIEGVWVNGVVDSIDWKVWESSTPTPGTGPFADFSGDGRYVYFETSGCVDAEAQLLSRCIQLNKMGTDTCNMSFAYHMKGLSMGTLRLEVTDDGANTWVPLWEKSGNQGAGWKEAYIGLGDFPDGAILQFRFVAIYGNGSSGDMALDNIAFRGSQLAGAERIRYFLDNDGDGYGQTQMFLEVCSSTPPDGYTFFPGDCDDNAADINPGMPEIACDGLDNNCNDDIINDDLFLPSIFNAVNDTICNGELATFTAVPDDDNLILWYNSNSQSNIIGFGNSFSTQVLPNNTAFPRVDTFFVGQTKNFSCFSEVLTPVLLVVNPTPAISFIDVPNPCVGAVVNLANINYQDNHFTGAEIAFYESLPADAESLLDPPIVSIDYSQTFYYVATSPQGCKETGSFAILARSLPHVNFSPSDSFSLCVNTMDTLYVAGQGTAEPYSFQWSNGSTQPSIVVSGQASVGEEELYFITMTDGFGCEVMDSVTIETSNSIDSIRIFVDDVTNCNGADGAIEVIPLNGISPFNYSWQGPNGVEGAGAGILDTIKITGLSQGVFDIFIFDDAENGCEFRLVDVIVQGPNAVIETPIIQPVSCNGGSDGEICVSIIGSATYLWSNGEHTECISGLEAGVYSLTVTSGDCETILSDLVVEEPESLVVLREVQNPSCGDSQDGQIELEVFGGTPPYQYYWEDGSHNPLLTGVPVGSYGLTVSDFLSCEWVDTIVIDQPELLEVRAVSYQPISCSGEKDGLIHVEGIGGVPPYTYLWNTNTSAPIIQNIASNTTLTVTVTDINGCTTSKSYEFVAPNPVEVVVLDQLNPVCSGDSTGFLVLGGLGGTPPFQFFVNGTLISGNTIDSLGIGDYHVIAKDVRGCTSEEKIFSLTASSTIQINETISNPLCVGDTTGFINLSISGTLPFSYYWGHSSLDTSFLDGLGVGNYALRVVDGDGCFIDTVFVLDAPQVFSPVFLPSDPSCFGVDDGLVDIIFSNEGTRPFTYNWSDGVMESPRQGMSPGNYTVTITDVMGCKIISDTLAFSYPEPFELRVQEIGDLVCKGDSTGFIELDIVGGTQPYGPVSWLGYDWDTKDISGVPEGDYQLRIDDANGCPIDTVFHIESPPLLEADTAWLGREYCRSVLEDTLVAVINGGVPPYSIEWSNGTESPFLFNVPEDNYTYSVTDANGCVGVIEPVKFEKEVGIIQIDSFYLIDSSCADGVNLSAVAEISNGSGNYLYHFTPTIIEQTNQTRLEVDNLILSGHYSVSVTDLSSLCQATSEIIPFSLPTPLQVKVDSTHDVNCIGGESGAIFVQVNGGSPNYFYDWKDEAGSIISHDTILDSIGVGIYSLDLADSHGCMSTIENLPVINGNSTIQMDTFYITDVKCRGDLTGSIDISVSGGRFPYVFSWDYLGGTPGEDLFNVPSGDYSVEVIDANNCKAEFFDFFIDEPADSLLLGTTVDLPSCFGMSDGQIIGQVTGGGSPYEYQWTLDGEVIAGETSDTLMDVASGTYIMIVSDTFGCIKNIPIFLSGPDSLFLDFTIGTPVPPAENGFIEISPQGGTPPYYYQWNTGDTISRIDNLGEAIYEVIVTDSLGCHASEVVELVAINDVFYENDLLKRLTFYPNPVVDYFTTEIDLSASVEISLELINILGEPLLTKYNPSFLSGKFEFDLQEFPAGSYFLKVLINQQPLAVMRVMKL